MSELASPVPYQLKIPDNGSYYQPRLQFHDWSPADFEAALQFGPKPIPIDAYSDAAKSLGQTIGERFNPSYQLQRQEAQDRLENYNDPNNPSNPNAPANAIRDTTTNLPTANLSDRPGVPNLAGSQVGSVSSPNTPNLTGYPAPASASDANRPLSTVPASQVGAVSNASAPDADGWHMTLGTTFATPNDLADFAKNHSLATGDNGIGLNGTNTATSTPYVALPPSTLRAYGIDPAKALGTPVTVQANGKTVQAVVADHLPDNAKNGAGIDLNPGTAAALGIDDVNNFKGQVAFKLGYDGLSTAPVAPSDPPPTASGSPAKGMLTATLPSVAPAAIPNTPLFGFQPNVAPTPNLPTLSLPRDTPDGTAAAASVVDHPLVAVGADAPSTPIRLAPPADASRTRTPILAPPPFPTTSVAAADPILAPLHGTTVSPAADMPVSSIRLGPVAPPVAAHALVAPLSPVPAASSAPAPILVPPGVQPLSDTEMRLVRSPLSKGEATAWQPTFLQRMQAVYGPGHATQNANGSVSYDTPMPLTPEQAQLQAATLKFKQGEADRDEARARREEALANRRHTGVVQEIDPTTGQPVQRIRDLDTGEIVGGDIGAKPTTGGAGGMGKNDTPEALRRQIATKGGDTTGLYDEHGTFDRDEAYKRLAQVNTKAQVPGADLSDLTPDQQDQVYSLAKEKYGAFASRDPNKLVAIANQLRAGADVADIRATTPSALQAERIKGQYQGNEQVKLYNTTASNYAGVKTIADKPYDQQTSADQLSLLFAYVNADNPRAAVTEAAFDKAVKTGTGLSGQIQNLVNGITNGKLLTADQVKNFEAAAKEKLSGMREGYLSARRGFESEANLAGIKGKDLGAAIGEDYDPAKLGQAPRSSAAAPPASGTQANPVLVHTQADWAALPSGTYYVDLNGKPGQKR